MQRDDLLAAAFGLARHVNLGSTASTFAGRFAEGGQAGSDAGCGGQHIVASRGRGRRNRTDRRKLGTKQHLLVGGHGVPLTILVTGANRHDVQQIIPLVVNMPAIGGKPGHPVEKPEVLQADRAYHDKSVDALLRWSGITPKIDSHRVAGLKICLS